MRHRGGSLLAAGRCHQSHRAAVVLVDSIARNDKFRLSTSEFLLAITAAGIAGFILSVGMAVDANILIAERTKEELRRGKGIKEAIAEGFHRAWSSIRDSNISSIITGVILFWFGTSLIEGFALTFVFGVVVSMFSAITVTRTFLSSLGIEKKTSLTSFLFSSGLRK